MLGYLSADIICSEKRTVFREPSSRKAVNYEEQIMSKDNYPSIFSPKMEAIVFLDIFLATHEFLKLGNITELFHERALAITNLISNKREWNNCFIKNAPKI